MHKRICTQTVEPGEDLDKVLYKDTYYCDKCGTRVDDSRQLSQIQQVFVHWQSTPAFFQLCDRCMADVLGFDPYVAQALGITDHRLCVPGQPCLVRTERPE